MSPVLQISREAKRDMLDAFGWYEGQRPGLGEEFLLSVDATLALIGRNPAINAKVRGDARRALTRRFPYAVFYVANPDSLRVLGILHTARDPEAWRRRIDGTG